MFTAQISVALVENLGFLGEADGAFLLPVPALGSGDLVPLPPFVTLLFVLFRQAIRSGRLVLWRNVTETQSFSSLLDGEFEAVLD